MIGHKDLLRQFRVNIVNGRMPHAQIFEGKNGYGTLPLAMSYAKAIVENSCQSQLTVNPLNHPDIHFFFSCY
jgi:DNA polymerase-3 subunit delta'